MNRYGEQPNRVDAWVGKHGWKIIGMIVASLTAWYTLKAQVADIANAKVDNAVFTRYVVHQDSLISEMTSILRLIRQEQESQHKYLCRGKQEQLGCQP